MLAKNRGKIALISVHGDPAINIGKEEAGGQNVYVKEIGEALANQGWQVDMFTRRSDAQQNKIVEHSTRCRTIRLTAGPREFVPRQEIFNYLPEFVEAFFNYQHQQKTIYPLIHTNYWLSAWVGMAIKQRQFVRHLHTYHSLGAVKYKAINTIPLIATTRLSVEKKCLETANVVVATSPQEEEDMRSLVSQKGNIRVIPCGTNLERFGKLSQKEARAKLNIAPETKVILYVGRFDSRKGIETLVKATSRQEIRQNQNLKVIIVGGSTPGQSDGIERQRIEGIVQELGLQDIIIFAGRVEHSELAYYYTAADVCVVPSHYEPFGLVAIEAMACGTPVVASDVGGLKFTVVNEVTGLVVPPQDEAEFARAIALILSDLDWGKQLGENAKKRVESKFSWNSVASQLDKLYLSQLGQLHQEFLTSSVVS
jgi:glycosyltransferase involved in cell wall biosynthesis